MARSEFVKVISDNVPLVGRQTAETLWDSGYTNLQSVEKASLSALQAAGIGRYQGAKILAFLRARRRHFRFKKNFDSLWDASEWPWVAALVVGSSAAILSHIFSLSVPATNSYFVTPLVLAGLIFSGLYWCSIPINKRRASQFYEIAFYILVCYLAHIFSFNVLRPSESYSLALWHNLFIVAFSATFLHEQIFRYNSPLNINNKTMDLFANVVVSLGIIWICKLGHLIFTSAREGVPLPITIILGAMLAFFTCILCIVYGRRVSERHGLPPPSSGILLFGALFLFLVLAMHSLLVAQDTIFSLWVAMIIDAWWLGLFATCLWMYALYPAKYFTRLGRIVFTSAFLFNSAALLRDSDVLATLVSVLAEAGFWVILGRVADVIQILGFLLLSGGLALLARKELRQPTVVDELTREDVALACEEILQWHGHKNEGYFDASNLCFNKGYPDLGIEVLMHGLAAKRWWTFDEGILEYQLACGHALSGNRNVAISHLRRAVHLYPRLEKFISEDEMLQSLLPLWEQERLESTFKAAH